MPASGSWLADDERVRFEAFGSLGAVGARAPGLQPLVGMTVLGSKGAVVPRLPGSFGKGDVIAGRYRVEAPLGSGGAGFVVAARCIGSRSRVALKALAWTGHACPRARQRHLEAARVTSMLECEHVARILETGVTDDGMPFIVTELLEGRTVAEELEARGRLPVEEAVDGILQACEGLAAAHAAGIVHGDLKPRNLFLASPVGRGSGAPEAEHRTLKLLDFGMPMPLAYDAEGASAWFASPAYLAPEQLRDPDGADARSDIWALGVLFYQLVSGTLPFVSDTIAGMFVAVAYDEPALLVAEDASFELARVVKGCLAKDPADRPRDVAALARALVPFAVDGEARASRVEIALSAPPSPAASRAAASAAAQSSVVEGAATQLDTARTSGARTSGARTSGARTIGARTRIEVLSSSGAGRRARGRRRRREVLAAVLFGVGLLGGAALALSRALPSPAESVVSAPPRDPAHAVERAPTPALAPVFAPLSLRGSPAPPASSERAASADGSPAAAALSDDGIRAAGAQPLSGKAPAMQFEARSHGTRSGATAPKPPRSRRIDATLSAPHEPYPKGFTHPTRLLERP